MKDLLLFKFCVITSVLSSANETSFSNPSSFALSVNIFSFTCFPCFYLFSIVVVTELDSMGSSFCPELEILFGERRLLPLHRVGSAPPWKGFWCWLWCDSCPLKTALRPARVFLEVMPPHREFLHALNVGQNQTGNPSERFLELLSHAIPGWAGVSVLSKIIHRAGSLGNVKLL